ncbi:Phospholipase D alpha 4 [Ancistrocladus abbreviatus]
MEEGKSKFLHGTLEVTIFHATPYRPSCAPSCLSLSGKPTYVSIKIDQQTVARTTHERDRVWNQTFQILCAHPLDSTITIAMKTKCSVLGKIHFQANQLVNGENFINGFFPLLTEDGQPIRDLQLQFILWFKSAEFEPSWRKLISDGNFHGQKNCTFPLRSNCNVTLYHDAHHHPAFQPPFDLPGGGPRKLWEDVYKALEGAKHLIYIAGWSLNPMMVLVRDPETDIPQAIGVKLGELLKQKAQEGVAVRLMLWDDETSIPLIKNKGLMRTHDEDAMAYFKNTRVVCRLCPRLHNQFPTLFSHHQKTITVDNRVKGSPSNREIMSFIGGVDLCDGRYDTEEHSLFRTLNTDSHANDFYQISIAGASLQKGGPREPWHDAHACVRGKAAWDILTNFEQRWTKQCDPSLLIPASTISTLFSPNPSFTDMSSNRSWAVQVFRSIDHFSVSPLSGKLNQEQSIHDAYVEAIRRAEQFIYIENQYFTGGCSMWEKDRHCGCRNLIPIEIALKVVEKIRARERFAVYIVIPMWPEGEPESEAVQDILHWTRETIGMMYRLIGEAIEEIGEAELAHPRDYLNFFCLANREGEREGEFVPPSSPHPSTHYWRAQKNRRFMVYVHSKLMIVDDLYVVIGSANINQRSMDGARDTEIAIGCYQAKNSQEKHIDNKGDIHAYRMSLWYEHTARAEELFQNPQSLECVLRLREIGEQTWQIYSKEEVVDMEGVHLVSYPVTVNKDGSLEDVMDFTNFPDTHTEVKGRRSKILPPTFTT